VKRTELQRKAPLRRKAQLKRSAAIQRKRTDLKVLTQTQQLDLLVRQIVLIRDQFRCRRCGVGVKPGRGHGLQAAHLSR